MPVEDARARMATQASRDERLAVADEVVANDGGLDALAQRVDELWAVLAARAELGLTGSCRTPVVRWRHEAHHRPRSAASPRSRSISDFQPSGDQPAAIDELERRIRAGEQDVVLLGATGTGKSATTAWLVEQLQRPTLVMAPNKTLAAQLANEFRELLPNNAVEYFVSYYDYYQPEAYVPQTDTYIEKDSSINEEVERLRHSATNSLLTRRDVIVVADGVLHLRPRHPAGVRRPDGPAQGRRRSRPRRAAAAVRRDPVHPQRHGVHPRHLPGPRRHPRDLPGLRGARGPDRVLRRRDRAADDAAPAHRRGGHRGRASSTSSRPPTTSPARSAWSGRSPASSSSSRTGWPSSSGRASCSRRSGCGCARPTTSR